MNELLQYKYDIIIQNQTTSEIEKFIQKLNKFSYFPNLIASIIILLFFPVIFIYPQSLLEYVFSYFLVSIISLMIYYYDVHIISPKIKDREYEDVLFDALIWGILGCILYGIGILILIKAILIIAHFINDIDGKKIKENEHEFISIICVKLYNSLKLCSIKGGIVVILLVLHKVGLKVFITLAIYLKNGELFYFLNPFIIFLGTSIILLFKEWKREENIEDQDFLDNFNIKKRMVISFFGCLFYFAGIFVLFKTIVVILCDYYEINKVNIKYEVKEKVEEKVSKKVEEKVSKKVESILIDGNFQYQCKLIENTENIGIRDKFPKYPIIILTCMDPGIDVHRIFQLEPGDVFVLRNAGNILTNDTIRSILIAIHEHNIKQVVVLGHLDCGMTKIKLSQLKLKLLPDSIEILCRSGHNPNIELRNFFKLFTDELENIKYQIKELKNFKGIPGDIEITGMLYDVDTGWIFDYETIKNLKFIENFEKKYNNLLYMKRIQFNDFLESNEIQIVNSGGLIIKSGEGVRFEYDNGLGTQIPSINKNIQDDLINQEEIKHPIEKPLSKFPKVKTPRIYLPRIKVNIPNIYKKNKQESDS